MAENDSAVVATTVDNTIDTNKDPNMIVTSKKNRMSNSDRMPPVINWSNVSSDTKVTNSVKGGIPTGHILQKSSAAGSPLDLMQPQFPIQFMQPPQFMQSPNPSFGGYQGLYGAMTPPPAYGGYSVPAHHYQQMGFMQPSFEDTEEEECLGPQHQFDGQPEGAEEECQVPIPVSLLSSKVEKRAVQAAIAERMSDALYTSDSNALKTIRELAVEKAYLPSNLSSPIPKLDGKFMAYVSQDCLKEDASITKQQENIWMLLQPTSPSHRREQKVGP